MLLAPLLRQITTCSSILTQTRGFGQWELILIFKDMDLYQRFEPVKVEFHLDSGYTKVILERFVGIGMLCGRWFRDIPTASIPPHLRYIGSRFLLSWYSSYNSGDSKEICDAFSNLPIVQIE
jgi:hypothetical protein